MIVVVRILMGGTGPGRTEWTLDWGLERATEGCFKSWDAPISIVLIDMLSISLITTASHRA